MRRILGFLTSGLLLAACIGGGETDGVPNANIEGQWVLESGTVAGEPILMVEGRRIDLMFNGDGTFGGTSACNEYGGSYETKGSLLMLGGDTSMTAMGCEPDVEASEGQFMDALREPLEVASVSTTELHLTGPEVDLVFGARG